MWFRVFGTSEREPDQQHFAEILQSWNASNVASFQGDAQGWYAATLKAPDGATLFQVDRYLASEEGIRSELNSWAAWLESQESQVNQERLMLHVISTKQLFTIDATRVFESPSHPRPLSPQGRGVKDRNSLALVSGERGSGEEDLMRLCQFLARQTAGVYQVDGMGFFDQDGSCLLAEMPEASIEN